MVIGGNTYKGNKKLIDFSKKEELILKSRTNSLKNSSINNDFCSKSEYKSNKNDTFKDFLGQKDDKNSI